VNVPSWVAEYIGIPFLARGRDREGINCWALLGLVFRERYGVELPEYVEVHPQNPKAVGEHYEEEIQDWLPVESGQERAGDVLSLRTPGWPLHVGLVVRPGLMLHIATGTHSVVESYQARKWERRISGIFRHRCMA